MYNQTSDINVLFNRETTTFQASSSANNAQLEQSLINRGVLDELTLGDPDLLHELINIYLEQFELQLQEIETAIETKNSELLFRVAHKAVGGNATFGMSAVVPALRQLEKMGKEAQFTSAPELLASIRSQFAVINSELQAVLNEKSS